MRLRSDQQRGNRVIGFGDEERGRCLPRPDGDFQRCARDDARGPGSANEKLL